MIGEVYEWPETPGKRASCMRGFARWLAEIEEVEIPSLLRLRILHDEYCCHAARAPVTKRQLARRVSQCGLIEKYRDTRTKGFPTRYRVDVEAVERAFRRAA